MDTRIFFYKKPVYNELEAGAPTKLSILNFLVSEKLRDLFLKQNIFPLGFFTRCQCGKIFQFSRIDVKFIRMINFDCQFRVSMG